MYIEDIYTQKYINLYINIYFYISVYISASIYQCCDDIIYITFTCNYLVEKDDIFFYNNNLKKILNAI